MKKEEGHVEGAWRSGREKMKRVIIKIHSLHVQNYQKYK